MRINHAGADELRTRRQFPHIRSLFRRCFNLDNLRFSADQFRTRQVQFLCGLNIRKLLIHRHELRQVCELCKRCFEFELTGRTLLVRTHNLAKCCRPIVETVYACGFQQIRTQIVHDNI